MAILQLLRHTQNQTPKYSHRASKTCDFHMVVFFICQTLIQKPSTQVSEAFHLHEIVENTYNLSTAFLKMSVEYRTYI